MSTKKKGIRQMPGKSCSSSGEPEQDPDRGTEDIKGPLLCENRITGLNAGGGLRRRVAVTLAV